MSKASELIKDIEGLQEMQKLSLVDGAVRNVARELEFNPIDTTKNSADHMVFRYGDKELIIDRKGTSLTFTYDGKVIHTAPEATFDLTDFKAWDPICKIVKKGVIG